jgi:hypothetical protein
MVFPKFRFLFSCFFVRLRIVELQQKAMKKAAARMDLEKDEYQQCELVPTFTPT